MIALVMLVLNQAGPCVAPAVDAPVEVALKRGTSVTQVAAWFSSVTCREVNVAPAAASLPIRVSTEGAVPAGALEALVGAVLESAGARLVPAFLRQPARVEVRLGPCDPRKARAAVEAARSASTCTLDLSAFGRPSTVGGCLDNTVVLEAGAVDAGEALRVRAVAAGSILAAVGLEQGDELIGPIGEASAAFQLQVRRKGAVVELRCAIDGPRDSAPLHPATLLRGAITPSDSCLVTPNAFAHRGEVTEVDVARAPGFEPRCLLQGVRVVPAFKDGVATGLKLFSLRAEHPLALVGLQNGDVVESVNGVAVDRPEALLAQLLPQSRFVARVSRRGQPLTLTVVLKRAR
ncbi:MAG: hypothetical protein JNJ54_29235 [Myxococcaceae bacterium]|nr:hypothetical protein [Myxococcaceae bacterium]